jgi:vacuole morphology and inheritance protein 14
MGQSIRLCGAPRVELNQHTDPIIVKGLNDKFYEKRKNAALDLEKFVPYSVLPVVDIGAINTVDRVVREAHSHGDHAKVNAIIDQLVEMYTTQVSQAQIHVRNGGLVGLAGVGIALGQDIAPYMERFIHSLLVCFSDPEGRIRYFACESMYNIAKVSKGEILVYFNPIFDSLSKVASRLPFWRHLPDVIVYLAGLGRRIIRQEWLRVARSIA